MERGSIQLAYGFVPDKNPGGELHFDLQQNFRKELLFEKQPYVCCSSRKSYHKRCSKRW